MAHRVENQPPPLADYNLWQAHPALREAVQREGADWAVPELDAYGARIGTARMQELAALANRHPPELHTHDRFGHRIDRVDFHPAWHELMDAGVAAGLHERAGRQMQFFGPAQVRWRAACRHLILHAAGDLSCVGGGRR